MGLVATVHRDEVGGERLDLVGVAQRDRRRARARREAGRRAPGRGRWPRGRRRRTRTSVSNDATSGSSSSTALRWWNAPTTRERGRTAAACSAAEPSATGRAYAPCLSKPSGLTQSTTTLPASSSSQRHEQRRRWPSHGTATITTSAVAAHSAFDAPAHPVPDLGRDPLPLGPRRATRARRAARRARAVRRDLGPAHRSRRGRRRGRCVDLREGTRVDTHGVAHALDPPSPRSRPARWVHGRPAGRRAARAAVVDGRGSSAPRSFARTMRRTDDDAERSARSSAHPTKSRGTSPRTSPTRPASRASPELAPDPRALAGPGRLPAAPVGHPRSGSRWRAAVRPCSSSPRTPRPRACSSGPGTRASSAPPSCRSTVATSSCRASPTSRSRSSTERPRRAGVSFDTVQHLVSAAAGETGPDGSPAGTPRLPGPAGPAPRRRQRAEHAADPAAIPLPRTGLRCRTLVTRDRPRARPHAATGRHPAADLARLPPACSRPGSSPTSAR